MGKKLILVVDDEPDFRKIISIGLKRLGYEVFTASNSQEALDLIHKNRPNLILMDVGLEGSKDGIETAKCIHTDFDIPIVYLTGRSDDATVELAKATEPFGYIVKPIDHNSLKSAIEIALYKAETEDKLKTFNKELCQANQRLSDFASIVSHDLKSPLNSAGRLAQNISMNSENNLSVDNKEDLDLLMSRFEQMRNLIDGVLEYSGIKQGTTVQVNLNEIVRGVIDMIGPSENINISIESQLPTIECKQTAITQIFQNLLNNAVKYIDRPDGQIKVACVEDDGFWKFSVADNGPGIEDKYVESVFEIFKTLSPRDKMGGSGIGLSIVKKVAEMYDGKAWVESEVGKGSTFFFTLSKKIVGITDARRQANITC